MPSPTVLTIDRLSYSYPGAVAPALSDISFRVGEGECLCLTGNSGCGKSTLLLAALGILRGGSLDGAVTIGAHLEEDPHASRAGIVFQNPESQMLCTTVAEEVAFGPENLCVPPDETARRVAAALQAVGLAGEEDRSAERFSAGQKQRLNVAAALALNPKLLLLDEPTSQLDAAGKRRLAEVLAGLKRQGYTMLLAEHDPRPFAGVIDRYLLLQRGRLAAVRDALPEPDQYLPPPGKSYPPPPAAGRAEPPHLKVKGLCLGYPETGAVLRDLHLEVPRGERVHLFGLNGAGKSSLLRCLCGLEPPDAGSVCVAGIASPRPEQLPGKVGVLFQNPARQLFSDTVHDEVSFTLCRLGVPGEEVRCRVAESLLFCGIADLAERAPLTLSFGEQHRVALAAVLAPRPELLLLDEPFAGLDYPQRLALLDILAHLPARYGTTVLIASHDELPDPRWADHSFALQGGRLAEISR